MNKITWFHFWFVGGRNRDDKTLSCLLSYTCLRPPIPPGLHLISLFPLSTLFTSSHSYVPTFFFHPFFHLALNISPSLHLPSFLIFFQACVWLSMQMCDPSHQQLGRRWREPGPGWAVPPVCVFVCLLVFFCSPVCMLARVVGHTLAYVHAYARPASSARSGFNRMIGTLLTLAVGVIQTLSRSHRLQQAPLLRIKANHLSPARWWWSNG